MCTPIPRTSTCELRSWPFCVRINLPIQNHLNSFGKKKGDAFYQLLILLLISGTTLAVKGAKTWRFLHFSLWLTRNVFGVTTVVSKINWKVTVFTGISPFKPLRWDSRQLGGTKSKFFWISQGAVLSYLDSKPKVSMRWIGLRSGGWWIMRSRCSTFWVVKACSSELSNRTPCEAKISGTAAYEHYLFNYSCQQK